MAASGHTNIIEISLQNLKCDQIIYQRLYREARKTNQTVNRLALNQQDQKAEEVVCQEQRRNPELQAPNETTSRRAKVTVKVYSYLLYIIGNKKVQLLFDLALPLMRSADAKRNKD